MVESFRGRPYAERRFRAIVNHARAHNTFYREWIRDPEHPSIVSRRTFLENNEAILGGFPASDSTSGSTGMPVRFSHSAAWVELAKRDSRRFVRSLGPALPGVQIVYAHYAIRTPHTLHISTPVDDQIQFILRGRDEFGCAAVATYPTNAEILCERILERGDDMAFIYRFGMYGEAVEAHQRRLVGEAFPNARICTNYSSKEFGLIAAMCPYDNRFHHIMAHRLGVEVLHEDGSPVSMGERGTVVVTDYFNRRSPFIRYEIGDLAVPEACSCGRNLPAFREILGKVRGFLVHRNGDRVAYVDLLVLLRGIPGLSHYQVIQHRIEEFTVRVVADRDVGAAVRSAFDGYFGYVPDQIRIDYVPEISRGENGKYQLAISHV